ncbi:MAG: hypothetical protein HUJ56_08875 [Erysipelotrichaceae bacterium]|nr:hypothetical protein [Erysipelotrichaceae bacterium]
MPFPTGIKGTISEDAEKEDFLTTYNGRLSFVKYNKDKNKFYVRTRDIEDLMNFSAFINIFNKEGLNLNEDKWADELVESDQYLT